MDQLSPGDMAVGYTAVQGRTPVAFDVEILGILEDGIAPDLDFIMVKVSGAVIDETGGIAAGFSGSPVYIGDDLVGAIAYGFFAADQTVGGVTPAEDMVELFGYPKATGAPSRTVGPKRMPLPPAVTVPRALRQAAAEATGQPESSFPTTAERLTVPVAISGLNSRAIGELQQILVEMNWPVALYRAGSAAAPVPGVPAPPPPNPGEPFAGVISYGDLTFAGVGTTTAVCGNLAVAFGHPFFFEGPTTLGMNAADVLTVVKDPSSLFGPFKVASVAENLGVVDQDRLAGIRGIGGSIPTLVGVESSVTNPDLARSRDGETTVVVQEAVPFVAAFHALLNLDVAFDRIGDGTTRLGWTVTGERESGGEFSLTREDMYYSGFDASFVSIFDLYIALLRIQNNSFEDVEFTSVDIDGNITQKELQATITKVQTASSLQPNLRQREFIKVQRGTRFTIRVFLDPAEPGPLQTVTFTMKVTKQAPKSGKLKIEGGGRSGYYYYGVSGATAPTERSPANGDFEEGPSSLDDLLAEIAGGTHAFDLIATLFPKKVTARRNRVLPQDTIVLGEQQVRIIVVG
ncbi:MAG: hypothetical protein HY658_06215 [Actinobacteria bacterium]|nr:hypothetical protein [Actinomycetota bacterium]